MIHLLRLPVNLPRLLRFAHEHGITQEDETLGYTLHAWMAALFGPQAPKPFRYFERRQEVLAYASTDAEALLSQAQAFASPAAWAALVSEGVASKPMPDTWREGQPLHLEVLTCPVSRKDDQEKDLYLRALDRLGADAPPRSHVYRDWFERQWQGAVRLINVDVVGMSARSSLLRRSRNGSNRLQIVERPQALLAADAVILDGDRFSDLLARGIGRHRAFGFGMILLRPSR